ncbi:MAG: hypothetical protein IPP27_18815 [Bacteroidetes bacterium]|nr:hypothetical protein [Bacteroidota bacterium]
MLLRVKALWDDLRFDLQLRCSYFMVYQANKIKDGVDFTYNWSGYSGGPFVVPAQYINAAVSARITYWLSQGVQGTYAIAGSLLLLFMIQLHHFLK